MCLDWRDGGNTEDEFFALGRLLTNPKDHVDKRDRPNQQQRLGKKKYKKNFRPERARGPHRWGVLSLLLKNKMWAQLKADPAMTWGELRWRVIVSYFDNTWKNVYPMAGQLLSLMAVVCFPLGNGVPSVREFQG